MLKVSYFYLIFSQVNESKYFHVGSLKLWIN